MKYLLTSFWIFLFGVCTMAQNIWQAPFPSKFDGLDSVIWVEHFPSPVYASTDPDEGNNYIWKHNSSIMSPVVDLQVEEGGAYIFYNDMWNLRVSYSAKEFSNLFHIPKGRMKAGQVYTFPDNWRYDSSLIGGWAMWYVIGQTPDGKRVYGVGKLDTVGALYAGQPD
jgi:hypothetical protein